MTEKQLEERLEQFKTELTNKFAVMIGIRKEAVKVTVPPIKPTDPKNVPPIPEGVHRAKTGSYKPKGKYFIGADIGEGFGGTYDGSAFSVVEKLPNGNLRQVAWYDNNEINPVDFAGVLDAVGRNWNDATLAPEVNRYDSTIWQLRTQYGYPNLYKWKRVDSKNSSNLVGWYTNVISKQRIIDWFRKMYGGGTIEINDPLAKNAFKQWFANNLQVIDGPMRDDHMQALMIATFIASEWEA